MSTMQTQLSASQTRATNTGLVPQAPRSLDSRQLFITIPHCGRTYLKTRLFDFHLFVFHGKQTSHRLLSQQLHPNRGVCAEYSSVATEQAHLPTEQHRVPRAQNF